MVPPQPFHTSKPAPRRTERESLAKLKVPKTFGGGSGMLTGEPRCKQRGPQISEESHDTIHRWRRMPKTGPRQPQTAQDRPSESPKQPKRATLGAMNFDMKCQSCQHALALFSAVKVLSNASLIRGEGGRWHVVFFWAPWAPSK